MSEYKDNTQKCPRCQSGSCLGYEALLCDKCGYEHDLNQQANARYLFNAHQLSQLLHGTIEMFLEYRDIHGKNEEQSQTLSVSEMFQGLDAEMEMFNNGDLTSVKLQSIL